MKKIVFLFGILFCSSGFAQSNWVFVTRGETSGNTFFVDVNSIQRSGDSVTFWSITNYTVRTKRGDLSDKAQSTVNCRTRETILRWLITYDDQDNMGKMTSSFAANDSWRPIAPDSNADVTRLFVCKSR